MSRFKAGGTISGSYQTRSGETVWIVAWYEDKSREPVEVRCTDTFEIGQRVWLTTDGALERAG